MRHISVEPDGTERKRGKYVFGQCLHGFHATVGAVVVTCLFCREMPLRSACPSTLTDSAARLIALALRTASWHPRGEEPVCLFETAPLTHRRCGACWCLSQEQFTDTETNKYVFCCNVAKHGFEHDHLRALVVIRNQMRRLVWCPCCSIACAAGHVLASMSFSGEGMSFSISYIPIEDLPTRRQSREVSCFIVFARLDVPTT